MYELLCCKAKQLQNVEKSLKCIKIAVSLKSVKLMHIIYLVLQLTTMCSLCLGGKGKEEVGYLSKSLDFSFSMNVNSETYHLRCSEKSINLLYVHF